MSCSTLFQYLINHLLSLRFCNALKKEHYFFRCGLIFFGGGSPRCGYVPNNSRFFVSWKIPKKANMPAVYAMQPESIHFRKLWVLMTLGSSWSSWGAYDKTWRFAPELWEGICLKSWSSPGFTVSALNCQACCERMFIFFQWHVWLEGLVFSIRITQLQLGFKMLEDVDGKEAVLFWG